MTSLACGISLSKRSCSCAATSILAIASARSSSFPRTRRRCSSAARCTKSCPAIAGRRLFEARTFRGRDHARRFARRRAVNGRTPLSPRLGSEARLRRSARIRYARVLGRRGRHAEAVAKLHKVTSTNEPLLEYLRRSFLRASWRRSVKRTRRGRRTWRAIKLFPLAQSPRIALSRLGGAPADRQAARSAVLALASDLNVDDDRADPWWTYEYDQGRHRVTRLAFVRAVRDERPR